MIDLYFNRYSLNDNFAYMLYNRQRVTTSIIFMYMAIMTNLNDNKERSSVLHCNSTYMYINIRNYSTMSPCAISIQQIHVGINKKIILIILQVKMVSVCR